MKIHELRFKNLNSLYGEWIIDFTDPAYGAESIFALIGPTGAGKSTILDGLCLALYGATPRLGKITRSSNEIISRQTGECYAEVLFESQSGRFRCRWEQRRARRQVSGNLQDQQHQISDADTGRPIETKKSLVVKVIEAKTGMDFDRFTRSILLAQGGFDTFLKADDEQKSKILEQITGTEIYSAISRRVHERQRDEQQKLNLLKAEASTITILDAEQEKKVRQTLEEKQNEETKRTGHYAIVQNSITWLTGIEKLKREIDSLADEEDTLNERREDFAPDRQRLDQAVRAATVEGRYATLVAVRAQRAEDQSSLESEKETLPALEAAVNSSAEALKSAERKTLEDKNERTAAAPLLQRIRALDQHLGESITRSAEIEQTCKDERGVIDTHKENRRTLLSQQKALNKALKNVERYLSVHTADRWLIGGLAGIEEQLASLLRREAAQQELEDKRSA
ncbi:MAG: AAA family ATPase, partial [Desulfofustis sp.]